MKLRQHEGRIKSELNMTSMIDIVFLLLVFFVMTFKIVDQEGDFTVRMPLADQNQGPSVDDPQLPLTLRLVADDNGTLTSMRLNEVELGADAQAFEKLRGMIVGLVGDTSGPEASDVEKPELEIDTDYNLRYENIIKAITAVSGYSVGDETVKLIEKIKFAAPRK